MTAAAHAATVLRTLLEHGPVARDGIAAHAVTEPHRRLRQTTELLLGGLLRELAGPTDGVGPSRIPLSLHTGAVGGRSPRDCTSACPP
ncbi:hypothetical protein [Streptomyces sp. NPDC007369]|uniref:hypothetical protein n=1 Tax=Streptomyces sp. NPDC007369 TaxID=3154589 RepID=UPI0033D20C67